MGNRFALGVITPGKKWDNYAAQRVDGYSKTKQPGAALRALQAEQRP